MRLRNKKTGEIVEYISFKSGGEKIVFYVFDTAKQYYYNSLAELNEEWEDVPEEPKEYWFIDSLGEIQHYTRDESMSSAECGFIEDSHLLIGNVFATKEKAEKAVEKLKAWKRLKDKGLELNHWKESPLRLKPSCFVITGHIDIDHEVRANLDLLFGGEE